MRDGIISERASCARHVDEIQEPHVLVRFAEAASFLEREEWVLRALQILERLEIENNQSPRGEEAPGVSRTMGDRSRGAD